MAKLLIYLLVLGVLVVLYNKYTFASYSHLATYYSTLIYN